MSASERLRALDGEIDTPRFLATLNFYIGPGARTATSHEQVKTYHDVKAALNALPLIADVVEAAELVVEKRSVYIGIPMDDGRPSGRVHYPLDDALTALREHLEGQ